MTIAFLFAERNFRLCVYRNFDLIFDPVLPEPNRIFGLLNLSISTNTTVSSQFADLLGDVRKKENWHYDWKKDILRLDNREIFVKIYVKYMYNK